MLHYMERSTIHFLKHKGWTNVQIAEFTGHHRDTIARVLREEVDKHPQPRQRVSAVAVYDAQISGWLDKDIPVIRMLELARADAEHPYTGGETAFYDYVRKVRRARKQTPRELALRFEGIPGEFLQIDWGEMRHMAFTKQGLSGQTRYFFAARLKYSRYMFVSFQQDMREETRLALSDRVFHHHWWSAVGRGDRQYENSSAGARQGPSAHLESCLSEVGSGVQIPPGCVCAGFREPEGSGRESGHIGERKFPGRPHVP
jgi:transposase